MAVSEERRPARGEGRGERLTSALDQRLPVSAAGKEFPRKSFPDHWSFLLGELALYSLLVPVKLLTRSLRTALFVLPFLTYHAPKRACLGLQAADRRRLLDGETTAEVRRTAGGGYEEAHTLLSREEAYRILVRDTPRPRAQGTEAWRWFHRHRLRNALSRWYFGKSGEMPATAWQRRRVAFVRAAPGEVSEGAEKS
ncbi:hypothetical protein ACIBJF_26990 [Streptomyces sp. NPDC050743]|uniref:hypothetical protein n=1 Tax=Streptomyces sp. NPDC050743 TaxID=3365634 RepID=UPI003792EF6C